MIGILLSGGSGSRLSPITKVVNKHILPVFDRPMIYYPLQTMIDSGLKKIVIVCGSPFEKQIRTVIEYFPGIENIIYSYVTQPKSSGMADAIIRCKTAVESNNIMVIAGDNIYEHDFKNEVTHFKQGAMSFLRQVKDPSRFATPLYNGKKLLGIEEKPKNPQTDWVVTGPHFFDKEVFNFIDSLKPSGRGELEITDLNKKYLESGLLTLKKKKGFWSDAGTYDSLLQASIEIKKRRNQI